MHDKCKEITSRLIMVKLFKTIDNRKKINSRYKQRKLDYIRVQTQSQNNGMKFFESVEREKCEHTILYLMKVNLKNKGKQTSSDL